MKEEFGDDSRIGRDVADLWNCMILETTEAQIRQQRSSQSDFVYDSVIFIVFFNV